MAPLVASCVQPRHRPGSVHTNSTGWQLFSPGSCVGNRRSAREGYLFTLFTAFLLMGQRGVRWHRKPGYSTLTGRGTALNVSPTLASVWVRDRLPYVGGLMRSKGFSIFRGAKVEPILLLTASPVLLFQYQTRFGVRLGW
jgi:hypothetical protein